MMVCNTSLELHFLQTHFIPSNTSDWHDEIFQKGISPMKKDYHEK